MPYKKIIWTEDDKAKMSQLQQLGESVEKGAGGRCGPVGASILGRIILRSEKAGELAPLLPWLLTRKLGNHVYDQEPVVSPAILTPSVHESLKPVLPDILKDYVYDDEHASQFLTPARCIAKSGNADFIAMALPLFPEAFKRFSQEPDKRIVPDRFGYLACAYLGMGGNPDDIIEPLKLILESYKGESKGSFGKENKEHELAEHLCSSGFINLLNHPRIKDSKTLSRLLSPFAGEIMRDDRRSKSDFPEDVYVLTSIHGNQIGFVWSPRMEYSRYVPIEYAGNFRGEFLKRVTSEDVAEIAIGLFDKMKTVPNSNISAPAHRANKALKSIFGQSIRDLAVSRVTWKEARANPTMSGP